MQERIDVVFKPDPFSLEQFMIDNRMKKDGEMSTLVLGGGLNVFLLFQLYEYSV